MMRGKAEGVSLAAVGAMLLATLAGCVADPPPPPPGDPHTPQSESVVSFAPYERTLELEPTADVSANAAIGDVNGDGHLDVLLVKGRHWPGMSRVFLGDGRGSFPTAYDLTEEPYRSYSGSLVDLDGDGALDVVLSNDVTDPKLVLLNDGTGQFREASTFGDASWPTRNAATADLDGDGNVDIVAANRGFPFPSVQYVCLNQGGGRFEAGCEPFGDYSSTTITPADVNDDGWTDLVVPHRDGGQSYAYINGGGGRFSPADRVPFGLPVATSRAAAVGDVDEDGHQDIVMMDEVRGVVEIYLGEDGRSFQVVPSVLASGLATPYALLVDDLDQDGHADVLVGFVEARSAAFFGDGTGTFARLEFGNGEGAAYGFAVADIDSDGYKDIVEARSGATSTVYFGAARDLPVG